MEKLPQIQFIDSHGNVVLTIDTNNRLYEIKVEKKLEISEKERK